jgi:hypothetical protein
MNIGLRVHPYSESDLILLQLIEDSSVIEVELDSLALGRVELENEGKRLDFGGQDGKELFGQT